MAFKLMEIMFGLVATTWKVDGHDVEDVAVHAHGFLGFFPYLRTLALGLSHYLHPPLSYLETLALLSVLEVFLVLLGT